MNRYLLSTYRVEGEVPGTPRDTEEMKAFMQRVMEVEEEMEAKGAFVFGGALQDPGAAAVINTDGTLITDGPFAESKEQIAGFYLIDAENDDEARDWARRVAEATRHPIEVRRFAAFGRVKDMAGYQS